MMIVGVQTKWTITRMRVEPWVTKCVDLFFCHTAPEDRAKLINVWISQWMNENFKITCSCVMTCSGTTGTPSVMWWIKSHWTPLGRRLIWPYGRGSMPSARLLPNLVWIDLHTNMTRMVSIDLYNLYIRIPSLIMVIPWYGFSCNTCSVDLCQLVECLICTVVWTVGLIGRPVYMHYRCGWMRKVWTRQLSALAMEIQLLTKDVQLIYIRKIQFSLYNK